MSPYRPPINHRPRLCTSLVALVLMMSALIGCRGTGCLFTPSASQFVTPDYADPVIVVSGFRPCPIGRAYRRPLIIRAYDDQDDLVTEVPFSGLSDGVNPVGVPLYLGSGFHGTLHIRIAECPPLLDDPIGALRCEPAEWVREFTVRVPHEEKSWRTVRDVSLRRSRCLPTRD